MSELRERVRERRHPADRMPAAGVLPSLRKSRRTREPWERRRFLDRVPRLGADTG